MNSHTNVTLPDRYETNTQLREQIRVMELQLRIANDRIEYFLEEFKKKEPTIIEQEYET